MADSWLSEMTISDHDILIRSFNWSKKSCLASLAISVAQMSWMSIAIKAEDIALYITWGNFHFLD